MPALAEWMLHFPADWTPDQARDYRQFVLRQLVAAMTPCVQALGVPQTAGIMLSVVAYMVQCNPLAARDVCEQMANAYDAIEKMDPLKGASVQ